MNAADLDALAVRVAELLADRLKPTEPKPLMTVPEAASRLGWNERSTWAAIAAR